MVICLYKDEKLMNVLVISKLKIKNYLLSHLKAGT